MKWFMNPVTQTAPLKFTLGNTGNHNGITVESED